MTRTRKSIDNESENEYDDIVPDEETQARMKTKSDTQLRKELKTSQEEAKEYLAGWQRAKADLINFKRENEADRQKFAQFATQDLIEELLPVLDSFEAALKHEGRIPLSEAIKVTQDETVVARLGIDRIYKQMLGVLKGRGVEQMNPEGETFNPHEHDSVENVAMDTKSQDGKVVEVVQVGYKLRDKIIRAPKVKVGQYDK